MHVLQDLMWRRIFKKVWFLGWTKQGLVLPSRISLFRGELCLTMASGLDCFEMASMPRPNSLRQPALCPCVFVRGTRWWRFGELTLRIRGRGEQENLSRCRAANRAAGAGWTILCWDDPWWDLSFSFTRRRPFCLVCTSWQRVPQKSNTRVPPAPVHAKKKTFGQENTVA